MLFAVTIDRSIDPGGRSTAILHPMYSCGTHSAVVLADRDLALLCVKVLKKYLGEDIHMVDLQQSPRTITPADMNDVV